MIDLYWIENETAQLPDGGDRETSVVGMLSLDIVEQDTYDVETTITAHAVEEGVAISDHIIPQQDRVTVTAIVSGRQSTTRLLEGAKAGTFQLADGSEATGIIVPAGTDRRGDVHTTLRRLCREGIEVDVEGLRRPIEGWLIERLSSPRSIENAGVLVCDMTLVEVRFADVEEVDAPSPRVERGRRRQDRGRQSTDGDEDGSASNDPSDREQSESVLHAALRGLGS
jgi:hypothetical protein